MRAERPEARPAPISSGFGPLGPPTRGRVNFRLRLRSTNGDNRPMPFLELSLRCRAADESWLEQALEDVGALAVTLMDADAATPNERAVLEPGVGEQPLWAECVVTALFP